MSHYKTLRQQLAPKISVDHSTGCWNWTGGKMPTGYGRVRRDYRCHLAHRLVYEWLIGPIPEGLETDHICRNRGCVNPLHFDFVTHAENMRRSGLALKACKRVGHPYDEENTYIDPQGRRFCRECDRIRHRQQTLGAA